MTDRTTPFAGRMATFPSEARAFRRFVETAAETVRKGDAARVVAKDATTPALQLVIGRRGGSWVAKFQPRGLDPETGERRKEVKAVIGNIAEMSLTQARARLEELRKAANDGASIAGPRAERARKVAERRRAVQGVEHTAATIQAILKPNSRPGENEIRLLSAATLDQCRQAYVLHGFAATETDKWKREVAANLRFAIEEMGAGDVKPGDLKPATISHAIFQKSPSTARHRLGALRMMFRWLALYGAVPSSPADKVEAPGAPEARDRYFDAAEMRSIWRAADEIGGAKGDYVKLLALLPLRRGELAALRVGDISRNHGVLELRISKDRSKNKQEHRLPIVGEAAEIATRLLQGREVGELLIPLTETGKAMTGWSKFQKLIAKKSGVADFYFHAFRKVFASEAGEHGLDEPQLIDAMLNHAASKSLIGAQANYDFSKRMPRRASLLVAWGKVVRHAVDHGQWPRHADADVGNVIELAVRK